MALSPAVFLDKDGTLLVDIPFNVDPARMVLVERAAYALHALGKLGLPLVVVSNQPGVAYGRFNEEDLQRVKARLETFFGYCGARLAGFYYCPHHPDGVRNDCALTCACRKPKAGLLRKAASELGLALERSWIVGTHLDDVEAGRRAGCTTLLIDKTNAISMQLNSPIRTPHHTVAEIGAAADLIAALDANHTASRVGMVTGAVFDVSDPDFGNAATSRSLGSPSRGTMSLQG